MTVFLLAVVVGWHVIWNVTPALHTPLMSVTNAISGIIVIGALLQVSSPEPLVWILAAVAILIATVNVFGGFFVTQRMLQMFRK
jgi:NAD(P) transhydrogenase subunit alpha